MSSHSTGDSAARDIVFLSYRRDDSSTATGRLYGNLCNEFGGERVFQDRTMSPGGVYPGELRGQLGRSSVMLVVIGKDWLTASDEKGRRLDQPQDWVHREVLYGLTNDVLVIPVLLDHVQPPSGEELPGAKRRRR